MDREESLSVGGIVFVDGFFNPPHRVYLKRCEVSANDGTNVTLITRQVLFSDGVVQESIPPVTFTTPCHYFDKPLDERWTFPVWFPD